MRLLTVFFGLCLSVCMTTPYESFADSTYQEPKEKFSPHSNNDSSETFHPFTGKITRNKVRMRLQPNLDGKIVRELSKDELIVVLGESDEFYSVQTPSDTKAYVYRTFILDNVVEGNKVNVRTEPDLEAPILTQLNQGDRVEGVVSPLNSRWLEIVAPPSARYYICKEYVEKIGPPSMLAELKKRREEVNQLLNTAYLTSQSEMQKPFEQIHIDPIVASFTKIIRDYADFSEQASRAKELLATLQDNYTQKKIAYLEAKANQPAAVSSPTTSVVSQDLQTETDVPSPSKKVLEPSSKMSAWAPVEQAYFEQWSATNGTGTREDFEREEAEQAVTLRGLIELYGRAIKNKPGDYLLVNRSNNLPIAYLYSTEVNLQDLLGQEVTLRAVSRPNNNFAFPAYKVLTIE